MGKSHLANGLALEDLKRGLRGLSRGLHRLLADLHTSRVSGSCPRLMHQLLNIHLLVLDDSGMQPLSPQAAQDLYENPSERDEQGCMIITSNRAFEEWAQVFDNDLLASAALGRLTHHAHTLVIQGQSYRQRGRRKEDASHHSDTPSGP